jgi:hypothetical protein
MSVDEALDEQQFKELLEVIYYKVQRSEILGLDDLIEEIKLQYLLRKLL